MPRRFLPPILVPVVLLFGAGCSPKKVVAPLRPQAPGDVTYSNTGGGPVWAATGSGRFLRTVPLKGSFERQPHLTYVVFRDAQRNEDHVVVFDAAGELTVSQNSVSVSDEALYRVVNVQPVEPAVTVSVRPRPIELLNLGGGPEEPRVLLRSDGQVRVKYPALLQFDDTFGLDEVKAVRLSQPAVGGGAVTFVLVEKEVAVAFPSREAAANYYAELERVVRPMAPHVQLSTGIDWRFVAMVAGGVVGGLVLLTIIGAAIKGKGK